MSAGAVTSNPDGVPQLIGAFHAALAAIESVRKSQEADTGKYKYTYADLADVLGECKRACTENGLVFSQNVETHGDQVVIVTTLWHTSGEWMSLPGLGMPLSKDPQVLGGTITYLRRYALVSLFAMPTEDDDAGQASQRQKREDETGHRSGAEERIQKLLAGEHGRDPARAKVIRDSFREHFKSGITDLPVQRHGEALEFVIAALAAKDAAAEDAADDAWRSAAGETRYEHSQDSSTNTEE